MDARLQRRVQRYGWDLAARDYESLWHAQLAAAQARLLACASLAAGERVLDVACGTGLVSLEAARAVGPGGSVLGIDISAAMIAIAARAGVGNATFARMDAEALDLSDGSFDVVLCALGLMYMPDPARALAEMRRVSRPGGRAAFAVWGDRARCGWAPVFPIVDDEVTSEVCPLFFQLGRQDALAQRCREAGFASVETFRIDSTLDYADADDACDAAFIGGPVAMAWSRFDDVVRTRVRTRYVQAIEPWRRGSGYSLPGEFVVVAARVPA